jgi:hypothetical protein
MDIIDKAQDINENFLAMSLSSRRTLTLPFSGSCLSCGETTHERRFCDSDCRQHYEKKLRRD